MGRLEFIEKAEKAAEELGQKAVLGMLTDWTAKCLYDEMAKELEDMVAEVRAYD